MSGNDDPYENDDDPYESDDDDPYESDDDDSSGSGSTGTSGAGGAGPADESGADTLYRAVLRVARLPGVAVPALTVMVDERRGGWSGVARVNPRLASAEAAFDTLLRDGLVPGSAVRVELVLSAGSRYEGVVVRSWPSVITSVGTRGWYSENSDREALGTVSFQDPLSYLRHRTIWATFADCSLGEILGGVLSIAAGGDGRPTRDPVLRGMSAMHIGETLREGIRKVPCAIAVGEQMGYWLSRIFGRLGVRIEMRGDTTGRLVIELHDGKPSETRVNRDGGVWMTVNPRAKASATNLAFGATESGPALPARGALLDDLASGGAKRFGRPGPVETVITTDGTDMAEAEKQAAFGRTRASLSRVRVSMKSRQPGLLPGRVVRIGIPPHLLFGTRRDPGRVDGYVSLFGANEWQVADVSHLYSHGGYWNNAGFEKVGAGRRPAVPPEESIKIVSGVVDDGESDPGEPIERDRLGRIPVKFPYFFEPRDAGTDDAGTEVAGTEVAGTEVAGTEVAGTEVAETDDVDVDDASSPSTDGGTPWPPALLLAPVEPVAGNTHGFVRDHRQGDWCRVAVVNPFFAEIVGYGYRDDRHLSARISDATMGMVVRQGPDEWRGLLFRPDEDVEERELEYPGRRDDSESEDEYS